MLPTIVQETQLSKIDLEDISQYLLVNEVFIGDKARRYLNRENELQNSEKRAFYETCQKFWLTGAKYAVKKLPINSDLFTNLSWLTPRVYDYSMLNQVTAISQWLPQVLHETE